MNWTEEENKVKLHLLHSLARSQRALARMLESMAQVVDTSPATASELSAAVRTMAGYQRALAVKMVGLRIRKTRRGVPGAPWLSRRVRFKR
ncbi:MULTISPECIES: hypothetical protein [Paenibacillus]|uniref:hypothetical protein n=1 Tax=Paenibacillus TaxID=44249 RepID=UPI0022B8839D|nr:hypothetical protein [Paenibacillus caseinilyticus]MCZ8519159.1 hypothetical protein [Paenibacillus caseinilyticus]